jgi:basic membrane protein A
MIPELGGGSVDGGPGSDIIDYLAADGPVRVHLSSGTATYTAPGGTEHTVTVTAVEKVDGSAHDDSIFGDDRRNVLRGKQGDDYISGFDGDDTLIGGIGADVLNGDAGNDLVKGQAGDDTLYGALGEDDLVGGPGDDYAWGGPGNDRIRGGRKAEAATSADVAHGAGDDDTCLWAAGVIDCETIVNPPGEAKVCVALGGESDDGSFNFMAWQGALDTHDLGVYAEALEPDSEADFAPNIAEFVDGGTCDLVVTVGFAMQGATEAAAAAAPAQDFLVLDVEVSGLPNVRSSTFEVQEPSFLAGYLAAGMTATGKVGTFGGIQIPPVTAFMDGFAWGVEHYNSVHAASVDVLGWDPDTQAGLFSGGFDQASGETAAQTLIDQGTDVILPVAGSGLRGAAARCQSSGKCAAIGVDADAYDSLYSYREVLLSSVVKRLDAAVADTVGSIVGTGSLGSATYTGDLANGGTSLAPFHEFDDDVPQWLKDELAALEAAIVAGTITVG